MASDAAVAYELYCWIRGYGEEIEREADWIGAEHGYAFRSSRAIGMGDFKLPLLLSTIAAD